NIGQMTGLMALRAGKSGKVIAFEPHPELFRELSANVDRWSAHPRIAPIILHAVALSDRCGTGQLRVTDYFAQNRGSASLVEGEGAGDTTSTLYEVPLRRLDETLESEERIGVMKLDVEGHELSVLQGAAGLLDARRIRDLVFEEQHGYPTAVTDLLE